MLRRINPILPELLGTLVLYGLLVQVAGIWFFQDKLSFTWSLWLGILMAGGMVIHMSVLILDAVDSYGQKSARVKTTAFSILRYAIVCGIFGALAYFRMGNLLGTAFGVLGLKAAAYFYPFTYKFFFHRFASVK